MLHPLFQSYLKSFEIPTDVQSQAMKHTVLQINPILTRNLPILCALGFLAVVLSGTLLWLEAPACKMQSRNDVYTVNFEECTDQESAEFMRF